MEDKNSANNAMKNLGIVVAFLIIVLIIGTVAISRLLNKTQQTQPVSYTNQTTTQTTPVETPTPTMDVSNDQLDQDAQNVQNSLNTVDTNLNTATKSINNQSADTPQ